MLMICILHVNLWTNVCAGKVLGNEVPYYFCTWLESLCFIGVNVFGIITGYVYINAEWKLSRYLALWFQVAFYTVSLAILAAVLQMAGICPVSIGGKEIMKMMMTLPFGSSYWYFAAYTALFLCIPHLNSLLRNLSQSKFLNLLCVIAVILPVLTFFQRHTIYGTGYNFTWLMALYAVGAYLKRFPIRIASSTLLALCLLCSLVPLFVQWAGCSTHRLFEYSSPLFSLYGICCFLLFSQIRIENPLILRLVIWASPFSFGVYLIHVHPFVWKFFKTYTPPIFSSLHYPWWFTCACAIVLFFFCIIADMLRYHLFRLWRINMLAERLGSRLEECYGYLISYLNIPRM